MANYYDEVGVRSDHPQEHMQAVLDAYRVRLMQTGEIGEKEALLREMEDVLLDPGRRRQYNQDRKLPLPGERPPPASAAAKRIERNPNSKRNVLILAAAVAILVIYWTIVLVPKLRKYPEKVYLVDKGGGHKVAIILKAEQNHRFPNGEVEPLLEIVMLHDRDHLLVAESQVRGTLKPGPPVPAVELEKYADLKEPRRLEQKPVSRFTERPIIDR